LETRYDNQGNYALTAAPFCTGGLRHGSIDFTGTAGPANRWECDDADTSSVGNFDTIHRIWVK